MEGKIKMKYLHANWQANSEYFCYKWLWSVTLCHNKHLLLLHLKNQYFYLSRVSNFTKSNECVEYKNL